MILAHIMDNDLHRSKVPDQFVPYIETPVFSHSVPAIVSGTRGNFLIATKLVEGKYLRSGVFDYDSDLVDNLLDSMFSTALNLSQQQKWPNIFKGPKRAHSAFNYIYDETGGMEGQPRICLIPETWTPTQVSSFFGKINLNEDRSKYRKHCRVYSCRVSFPVFCSRPDYVGLYTQILGGRSSIFLHNVRSGLAFCP